MASTLVLAHKLRWLCHSFLGFSFRTIFLRQFLSFISKSTDVIITTLEILSSAPARFFTLFRVFAIGIRLLHFFLAQYSGRVFQWS